MSRAKKKLAGQFSQYFIIVFFLFQNKKAKSEKSNFSVPSLGRIEFLVQTLIFQIVFGFVPEKGNFFIRLEEFLLLHWTSNNFESNQAFNEVMEIETNSKHSRMFFA